MEGIDIVVKKVSFSYKWFEIYIILLKAKGKEIIIVWMHIISNLSFFSPHILYYTEQDAHRLSSLLL